MLALRHALRFASDLWLFTVRSGRWWITLLVVVLAVATVVGTATKVAAPVVTYTMF